MIIFYIGRFEYTGTRDYTPFLCLPASLKFIDNVLGGIECMNTYNMRLLKEASELVIQRWQSFYVVKIIPILGLLSAFI